MNDEFEQYRQLWEVADQFITDPNKVNETTTQAIIEQIMGHLEEDTQETPTVKKDTASGISVEWYQGRSDIIRYIYERQWTWDDLWVAFEQCKAMMESVSPNTVHVFVDMTRSTDHLPHDAWEQGKKLDEFAPANEGLRITIGASSFVQQTFRAKNKVIELGNWLKKSNRMKFAETLAEAENYVAAYDG